MAATAQPLRGSTWPRANPAAPPRLHHPSTSTQDPGGPTGDVGVRPAIGRSSCFPHGNPPGGEWYPAQSTRRGWRIPSGRPYPRSAPLAMLTLGWRDHRLRSMKAREAAWLSGARVAQPILATSAPHGLWGADGIHAQRGLSLGWGNPPSSQSAIRPVGPSGHPAGNAYWVGPSRVGPGAAILWGCSPPRAHLARAFHSCSSPKGGWGLIGTPCDVGD